MRKLDNEQLEGVTGGVTSSQAAGGVCGAALAFTLSPGLLPLGIATGIACAFSIWAA